VGQRKLLAVRGVASQLAALVADAERGKIGYYDEKGKIVIRATYDFGMPFENGRAAVCSGCSRQQEGEHYRIVGGVWWEIDQHGQKRASIKGPPSR
jgi:hypothetical protein